MTRERAVEKLEELRDSSYDPERAHSRADDILCDLLETLGYSDVVTAWRSIEPKWYA